MMFIIVWYIFLLCFDCKKLYEVVDLWWCCWYWCEYAKCRLLMVNLYMLNINIWYGDCMYWIMLLNSYVQFDDHSCGACMYERFLFWWWIMLLNYYMQTMVILMVNAYLQNEGDLGYVYISNGDDVGEFIVEHVHSVSYFHASWVLGCLHLVEWFEYLYPMVLVYLYQVEWFEYFVFNGYMMCLLHHEVTTCCWWWYHMYVRVVSRRIAYIWWIC